MNTTTVKDLFNADQFIIPIYQRDYAWKKKNFEDLWEDLLENFNMPYTEHFLGTIVLSVNNKKQYIIDGQQRVTTLFMLIHSLVKKSSDPSYRQAMLYTIQKTLKLEVSKLNSTFFHQLLENQHPIPETLGQKNLLEVFTTIQNQISALSAELVDQYLSVLEKMNILILKESNDGKAIRIFQSVNDRGVSLTYIDKLKSLLIYYSNRYLKIDDSDEGKLDIFINDKFGEIFKSYDYIKQKNKINFIDDRFTEDNILRYHYLSYSKSPNHHYKRTIVESYNEIKDYLKKISKNRQELEEYLENYTNDLSNFFAAFKNLIDECEKNLELYLVLTVLQPNTTLYPLIIRAYLKNKLDHELLQLIKLLDIQVFKMGYSPEKDTIALGFDLDQDKNIKDTMKHIIKNHKNRWNFITEYTREITRYNIDLYRFISINKEILHNAVIDSDKKTLEYIKTIKDMQTTIEHIFPQDGIKFMKKYEFKSQDEYEEHLHTYGNSLLLEHNLNSQASDKDLVGKQKIYQISKIENVVKFSYDNDYYHSFSKTKIKERNKEMIQYLENLFSIINE